MTRDKYSLGTREIQPLVNLSPRPMDDMRIQGDIIPPSDHRKVRGFAINKKNDLVSEWLRFNVVLHGYAVI